MRTMKQSVSLGMRRMGGLFSVASVPILVLFLAFLMNTQPAVAQIYSTGSNSGGASWTSFSTWVGGVVPDSTQDVVIVSNDSVYTSPSSAVLCNNIDIQSGAKLSVLGSSSGGGITVKGSFTVETNSWFYNGYTSETGWPNNAASYSIDPASNYVLTGAGSSTFGSNSADSTFGNVYVLNRTTGVSGGANLTILGDLRINTGGTGTTFRGISATTAAGPSGPSLVHHVKGNAYLISGVWSAVDGDLGTGTPMTCIWNIDGNVTVGDPSTTSGQARMGPFTSANSNTKHGIFNIGGSLRVTNGARLQCGSSSSDNAPNEVGEVNLKGNFTLDSTAAVAGNTFGSYAINFVGTGTQQVTIKVPMGFSQGSTGAYPTFCDTVASGATVVFTGGRPWGRVGGSTPPSKPANGWGTFVVNGAVQFSPTDTLMGNQDFLLGKGGTLGIATASGVDTSNTGNVQVTGTRTYPTSANYLYVGAAAQVSGNGLPTTVGNLTVDNSAGVTLQKSTTIAGKLTLMSGLLTTGGNALSVSNNQASAVIGDSSSYVVGSLVRAQGTTTGAYLFPTGTATDYRGATVNFTTAPSAASNLTASFTAADPTSVGLPKGISGYWDGGYWTIASDGTPGGTFGLTLYTKDVPSIDTGSVTILEKPLLTSLWSAAGTAGSVNGNLITETGVSSFGIFGIGYGTITGVLERVDGVPTKIALTNFPNPFNPSTQIQFAVTKTAHVTLTIYNDLGQKVATLVDQNLNAGVYRRIFDGSLLATGVYLSRLNVGDQVIVSKMLLIK